MRILERLEQLAAIGDRTGYWPRRTPCTAELAAGWLCEAGLEVEVDAAGNLIGRIPGGGRRVWTGSHLGHGSRCGQVRRSARRRRRARKAEALGPSQLGVVVFRDEERGCAGSRGCTAWLDAYVELHIEQGPTLLAADAPLGVVTAIVGYVRGRRTFTGTPATRARLDGRPGGRPRAGGRVRPAARDAARAIEGGRDGRPGDGGAGRHERHPRPGRHQRRRPRARRGAARPPRRRARGRGADSRPSRRRWPRRPATPCGPRSRRSLPVLELLSGAGHDAGTSASAGVPAGMLFVRSLNGGISHNPAELSSPEDIGCSEWRLWTGALRRLVT